MRQTLQKLYRIFDRSQKKKVGMLLCMMVVGALLETMGVSLILPFVSLILDSDSIFENKWMYSIYQFLKEKCKRFSRHFVHRSPCVIYLQKCVSLFHVFYPVPVRFQQ